MEKIHFSWSLVLSPLQVYGHYVTCTWTTWVSQACPAQNITLIVLQQGIKETQRKPLWYTMRHKGAVGFNPKLSLHNNSALHPTSDMLNRYRWEQNPPVIRSNKTRTDFTRWGKRKKLQLFEACADRSRRSNKTRQGELRCYVVLGAPCSPFQQSLQESPGTGQYCMSDLLTIAHLFDLWK